MAWTERLINLFRRQSLDAEIDAELQFHIEQRTRDNVAAGMTIDEARRDAERRLGGRLRVREHTRDADVLVWLESIGQDVRYAAQSPTYPAVAHREPAALMCRRMPRPHRRGMEHAGVDHAGAGQHSTAR
jgi:hypothetical protein